MHACRQFCPYPAFQMFQAPPRLDFGVSLDYLHIEKFKVDLKNLKFLANDFICYLKVKSKAEDSGSYRG